MATDPFAFASLAAEQLIKGWGLGTLPIKPIEIAQGRDIIVQPKPMADGGVSGMLVRLGNDFAISYATHLENEGFQNYSIAHELGHYFLPGHADAVVDPKTGIHFSRAGFESKNRYEIEADRFAAGLLMPRHLFFPALQRAGCGLSAIEQLATLCGTSLHATAIRFTQCTRDPVAIVVSRGNVIDHCFMSQSLQELKGIDWLKKRQLLPKSTRTYEFNQDPLNVQRAVRIEEGANLQDWFGGHRVIDISEDIIGLGNYGKTLTVLYDIDLLEPEDEEDEERLVDSWAPRFKK